MSRADASTSRSPSSSASARLPSSSIAAMSCARCRPHRWASSSAPGKHCPEISARRRHRRTECEDATRLPAQRAKPMKPQHYTTLLIALLRDSQPYLSDEGWDEVSRLMGLAADELERLSRRVEMYERRMK